MLRILLSVLGLIAVAVAWIWLVGAIGLWWVGRNPQLTGGADTYFIMSNQVVRWAIVFPLLLFSVWYWRRFRRKA
jgi:hypothetical protein